MTRYRQHLKYLMIIGAICTAFLVGMAAENVKYYKLVIDRPLMVAGTSLQPGQYRVQITLGEHDRAEIAVLQKEQRLVSGQAVLQLTPEPNRDDGLRAILPDGKTRILQELWFRGVAYRLNLENRDSGANTP